MIILSGCGLGVVTKVTPLLKSLRTPGGGGGGGRGGGNRWIFEELANLCACVIAVISTTF